MDLLFCDHHIAVCIKPVGMSSEAGPGSLPEALEAQLGGPVFPVHRLDLNVGGVMVYARTRQAAAKLSAAVQEGRLVKEYLAALHGIPAEPEAELEDLLWKDSSKNKVFVVKRERRGVKAARLHYRVLDTARDSALVLIRLYTGRSHQIRVQFSSRGLPLIGDHKYGSRDKALSPALWSCRIHLPHPADGRSLQFTALPEQLGGFTPPHSIP